jgi:hypothetical protein
MKTLMRRWRWYAFVPLIAALALVGAVVGVPANHAHAATNFQLGWYPNTSSYSSSEWSSLYNNGAGVKPGYITYYDCVPGSGFAHPLNTATINGAAADGIGTFLKMDDNCGVPGQLPAVANGSDNSYLAAFGKDIAANGKKISITYDWEMNGTWNNYGPGGSLGVTPAEYIQAWNNVVTQVSANDNGLVTWVWNPNIQSGGSTPTPVSQYWSSGGQTVKDVGQIAGDGYLCLSQSSGSCSQTYDSTIKPSMDTMRALDPNVPASLAETGIGGTSGGRNSELTSLVNQASADGLSSIMYFNEYQETLTSGEQNALGAAVKNTTGSTPPPPPATGYITSKLSGTNQYVLDDPNNDGSGVAQLQVWSPQLGGVKANEQWTLTPVAGTSYYTLNYAGNPALCVDNQHSVAAQNNEVWLYSCNQTPAQEWQPLSNGEIENVGATQSSGKTWVLADLGTAANGQKVGLQQATGATNQLWTVP